MTEQASPQRLGDGGLGSSPNPLQLTLVDSVALTPRGGWFRAITSWILDPSWTQRNRFNWRNGARALLVGMCRWQSTSDPSVNSRETKFIASCRSRAKSRGISKF